MKGLISKSPHIENILSGKKVWEIRGSNTKIRGEIALIKSGTSTVVGKCELVDVIGPISTDTLEKNIEKHCVQTYQFDQVFGKYRKMYAWVLDKVITFQKPLLYKHPQGAIIWVNLENL